MAHEVASSGESQLPTSAALKSASRLVLRRGGLGDTLLTAPLLRALRRLYPSDELHLAGSRESADVLCGYGVVDVAHSHDAFLLWRPDEARRRLASYTQVLGDEPGLVDCVLDPRAWQTGTPFALQLARQAGLEPRWPDDLQLLPQRPLSGALPHALSDGLTSALPSCGPIALAPGSGGTAKCWPRACWLQLAGALAAAGRQLHIVVGPVEIERDDPRRWPWPGEVNFTAEPTPLALAKRLEAMACFVGNDSGTTHLAAMLGVPTVALFVASDATVWAPVGPHVRVLGAAGRSPPVDAVLELF